MYHCEFNNLHFSELEEANNIPIIVYMLKKEKTYDENDSVRHKLHCIRVPSLNTFKKYNFQNICHLLMLSPTHLCYIPDIEKYMKNTLGRYKYNFRCRICFNCFSNETQLSDHLNTGICYIRSRNPAKLILKPNATISHVNAGSEYLPELTFIADS